MLVPSFTKSNQLTERHSPSNFVKEETSRRSQKDWREIVRSTYIAQEALEIKYTRNYRLQGTVIASSELTSTSGDRLDVGQVGSVNGNSGILEETLMVDMGTAVFLAMNEVIRFQAMSTENTRLRDEPRNQWE